MKKSKKEFGVYFRNKHHLRKRQNIYLFGASPKQINISNRYLNWIKTCIRNKPLLHINMDLTEYVCLKVLRWLVDSIDCEYVCLKVLRWLVDSIDCEYVCLKVLRWLVDSIDC